MQNREFRWSSDSRETTGQSCAESAAPRGPDLLLSTTCMHTDQRLFLILFGGGRVLVPPVILSVLDPGGCGRLVQLQETTLSSSPQGLQVAIDGLRVLVLVLVDTPVVHVAITVPRRAVSGCRP